MMMRHVWVIGLLVACGDDAGNADASSDTEVTDLDRVDATCHAAELVSPAVCGAPAIEELPVRGRDHVRDALPITYEDVPPSSGDHRPSWGKWGEYGFLPPQRWLHNLEHGGIALLYDPCLPEAGQDALRAFARALPGDDAGPARWVMTPYPGLPTGVAVVAWQWTWEAACLDASNRESLQNFVSDHYRKAPEDVSDDGSYVTDWIGR